LTEEIYEINGFQIRYFTKKEIDDLATAEGFKILLDERRI
jgi:hypothetical protein